MKSLRKFLGIVALFSLSVLFTACPDSDEPIGNNSEEHNSGQQETPTLNGRGPISYVTDDKTFKTVLVDGGIMGDFYIMQTEMIANSPLKIGNKEYTIDLNGDKIITKFELYCIIYELREDTGLPWRLPTRDEWTYAAKGGKLNSGYKYCGSSSIEEVAWYKNNSSNKPHGIAAKKPNELGLYDMSGNYAELCFNDTETNDGTNEINTEANPDGDYYGGCWNDAASECTPTSYKKGSIKGKVGNSTINEDNAVDGHYVAVRLVYSK